MATTPGFDRDVDYLRNVQYRDSTELAKRANLHVTYRSAPVSGFEFFASLVDWPADGHILDVGCGSGALWSDIAAVVPDGTHLTLTDLSQGMVDEACARATATGRFASVIGRRCDARDLPFDHDAFDAVVSTYALYHVPEPADAVDEIARVVRPDGTVAIMTNGPGHLREIEAIRIEVFGPSARYEVNRAFAPPAATSMLVERFDEVGWHRYDDTLHVTELDDVIAFMESSPPATDATPTQRDRMRALTHAAMHDGTFVVSKDTGAIVCRSRRSH